MQSAISPLTGKSFYSKLVRLEGIIALSVISTSAGFLFQTGSIRRQTELSHQDCLSGFYSKLVRLEAGVCDGAWQGRDSFYSKLVRLEVTGKSQQRQCRLTLFLFQTGSIRSLTDKVVRLVGLEFLFQTGSIRSHQVSPSTFFQHSFYSKLVRLEVQKIMPLKLKYTSFYSKLVRLEGV